MENKKQVIIGISIFVALILVIIGIKIFNDTNSKEDNLEDLKTVYVATGGGKEDFIADEDVVKIMQERYKLNVVYDSWSNGKLIVNPLVREDGITKYADGGLDNLMRQSRHRLYFTLITKASYFTVLG